MLRHQLPSLLSRAVHLWRYTLHLRHGAVQIIEMGLYRIQAASGIFRRRSVKLSSSRVAPSRNSRAGPAKRPLLIHYHIFKNAGSSFEWALEQSMGMGFQRFDSHTPGGILAAHDITRFAIDNPHTKAISSHQAVLPAPEIRGRKIVTSILIRDPIARIRSIYAFERRQEASTPGAVKAKEFDFKGYVEWRLRTAPAVFCNYQVLFCSRTEPKAPNITRLDLKQAITNLDDIDIVGTVERYDEWLSLAQSILSESFGDISLSVSHQNVSVSGERMSKAGIFDHLVSDLGEATAQHLLDQNELDMCLYQVADGLLTRRLGERGIKITLREAYATVRQDLSLKAEAGLREAD